MNIEGKGKLLKIFIGESDRWHGEALYHAIIKKIKENGLAGATTVRGIEGFGANSRVHTKSVEVLSQDLPIVIEIIDKDERINEIIKVIDPMITEGIMVILHDVEIIKYVKSNQTT
jgi:PII-like signaling protein